MSERVETWQLRAKFAAALSRLYGAEVPAYTTLVEVSGEVNRDCAAAGPGGERLGSLDRVTAERHGAIRVGSARCGGHLPIQPRYRNSGGRGGR